MTTGEKNPYLDLRLLQGLLEFQPLSLEKRDQRIQEIQGQMEEHQGEFVLVITREWRRTDWPGPGSEIREESYRAEENWYLGLATPPFLTQGNERLTIHTPRYSSTQRGWRQDEISVKDGPLSGWQTEAYNLERPLERKRRDFHWELESPGFALEIIVGDQEVSAWVLKVAEEHHRRGSLDIGILLTFQRMQKTLGREIPLPEPYREQVETEELKRKVALLGRLEDLTKQEGILRKRLAQIQKLRLPRIVLDVEDSTYEREVRQDEKDARIIGSIPILDKLKDVRARMHDALKVALCFGLHEEPWVITQEPTPGQQITVNVPELIRDYCQYYEVPIPQNSPGA